MEEFSTVLRKGDEGAVPRLVDADPTLLERMNNDGYRPLATAAWHGHLGVARLLIERGANVNATGSGGFTAVHYAAQEGHAEVLALLLRKGAHGNSKNRFGMTALMWACNNGHLGVVKMLVQHMGKQGVDESSDRGWTALHYAADEGHEEVVRFLLLAGADPTITGDMGRAPRALAEDHHYLPIRRERRARCVVVFQWWEGELERRALLSRATCLHKAYMTQRDLPTSQVPTYLEARVAAGHAVPVVEVVMSAQSEGEQAEQAGASGKRKAAGEGGEAQGAEAGEEETRHAALEYVVKGLDEALLTELLEGFH